MAQAPLGRPLMELVGAPGGLVPRVFRTSARVVRGARIRAVGRKFFGPRRPAIWPRTFPATRWPSTTCITLTTYFDLLFAEHQNLYDLIEIGNVPIVERLVERHCA